MSQSCFLIPPQFHYLDFFLYRFDITDYGVAQTRISYVWLPSGIFTMLRANTASSNECVYKGTRMTSFKGEHLQHSNDKSLCLRVMFCFVFSTFNVNSSAVCALAFRLLVYMPTYRWLRLMIASYRRCDTFYGFKSCVIINNSLNSQL